MSLAPELIEEIRKKAEIISREFNLNFQDYQLDHLIINLEGFYLLSFMLDGDCEELVREGCDLSNYEERAKNLHNYLQTNDYSSSIRLWNVCGRVMRKSKAEKGLAACKYIKEEDLRKKVESVYKKILDNYKSHRIIVLSYGENTDQKIINEVMIHEVAHWILFDEKINFSNLHSDYWIYDEGLAECLTYYALNKLDFLKDAKPKSELRKVYINNALKFSSMLEGKESPQHRKDTIISFLESLKNLKKTS